jgi:hypothetical protein
VAVEEGTGRLWLGFGQKGGVKEKSGRAFGLLAWASLAFFHSVARKKRCEKKGGYVGKQGLRRSPA